MANGFFCGRRLAPLILTVLWVLFAGELPSPRAPVPAVAPAAAQTQGSPPEAATAPHGRAQIRVPVEVEPGEPFRRPPVEVLQARRALLLDSLETGVVVLRSASRRDQPRDFPQDSDFRQDNDFFYLTGLETPDSWLVLVARGPEDRSEMLFVPERDPAGERWTGPRPGPAEAGEIAGIQEVRSARDFLRTLGPEGGLRLSPETVLYLPLGARLREDPVYERLVFESGATIRNLKPAMAQLRLVKDDFEVGMLRRAIDLTAAGHRAAMRAAAPGMYEFELQAIIEANFQLGGAERVGFPSIVGSGPNSVILHYDTNRRRMGAGDLVVIDVGAEYSYYTADVTRTIPVSGRYTPRQRRIYELVLGAQQAAMDSVRPGITVARLNQISREWMRENSGDACGERTCDAYFVHGLAHWLGMDVHDVGDYGTPLAPNMILTIEPGIYLPEEELGVRIEDDLLVTEDGYELLSHGAPRDPGEIEALMREGRAAARR